MDKRRKRIDPAAERALREAFFQEIQSNALTLPDALKKMRRISRLTRSEFSRRVDVGEATLKSAESTKGNPTVATLNKIGLLFGLEVGFVKKKPTK